MKSLSRSSNLESPIFLIQYRRPSIIIEQVLSLRITHDVVQYSVPDAFFHVAFGLYRVLLFLRFVQILDFGLTTWLACTLFPLMTTSCNCLSNIYIEMKHEKSVSMIRPSKRVRRDEKYHTRVWNFFH